MEEIFKTYASLFVMVVFIAGATGLISASIDAKKADDFMTGIITEISDTNFATSVIDVCKSKATGNGYELTVDTIDVDGDSHIDSAIANLVYHYTVSLFGVDKEHNIRAVIR